RIPCHDNHNITSTMQMQVIVSPSIGAPMLTQVLPLPAINESIVLADGSRLVVRAITPASKPVIAAAMTRLSPQSIRRRFFAPRRELSELEPQRLTAMDGWNQYALGVCTRGTDGALEGVGVARFARTVSDSSSAEIAITVVDAFQGR